MRRRLIFHAEYDEKFDYLDIPEVIDKARFKGEIVVNPLGRKEWRYHDGVFEDFITGDEMDQVGESFTPFGGHNYLYNFGVNGPLLSLFRLVQDPSVAGHEEVIAQKKALYSRVQGSLDEVQAVLYYMEVSKDINILLFKAAEAGETPFWKRVFYYNKFLKISSRLLAPQIAESKWLAPVLFLGKWFAFGLKRTLVLWGLGVVFLEGLHAKYEGRYNGWSVITYASYGTLFHEFYADPKLRALNALRTGHGLVVDAGVGFGLYEAVTSFYNDPAPFLEASKKTGVHHGAHHISILLGMILNAYSR